MASLEEMKKEMAPIYQERFDALYKIAFELHKLKEEELEMAVIKKLAGIKMLIEHCNQENI